jgi:hypothetical protein
MSMTRPTEIRHVADRGASCTRPPLATSDYCEYVSRMPTPCKPLCLHVPADRNVAREDWRPLTESATPAMPTVILSPSGWCCCSRAYLHVRGFARAGKRHVLNSGRDTRMYRHPCGWCTNVFCKLEHVSVTLCPAPTRRASVTGECCLAAGLSVSSLWWTNDSRDRSHPAFLFTSLSFLGWAPHSRAGHGLSYCCEMSPVPGSWKSPDGVSKRRCDAIVRGLDSRTCGLARRWSRVGRRCASRPDVVARKNDGWLRCCIRLTAGLTSVARIESLLRVVRSRFAFHLVVHD